MRMIASFEKSAQIRFVGHLDLMRAIHRALRRSGLPIRYSQGFNPHVLLSLASPLPVGVSGIQELMDVPLAGVLSEAYFLKTLRAVMPSSLPLTAARAVGDNHPKLMANLRTASYEATFHKSGAAKAMAEAIPAFLSRAEVQAVRRSKRGSVPCDIRPMLHCLSANGMGDAVAMRFRVSLTERETLKPDLLLSALAEQAGVTAPPSL
ncbi:MAG: TIGR03936 family radical SAM-associated protein, partial [Clostridia bacterium]|nr:TIGR03936 family radical SAM-associated protein [Clostridia bacterium]